MARLIALAATRSQMIVVSHAEALVAALEEAGARQIVLVKQLGETQVPAAKAFTWNWPSR